MRRTWSFDVVETVSNRPLIRTLQFLEFWICSMGAADDTRNFHEQARSFLESRSLDGDSPKM